MAERTIVHFEIPAQDPDTAGKFYKALFGWDYEYMGEPYNYTGVRTGPNSGGGLPKVSDFSQPDHVLIYIGSEDIEADLKKAESLGGKTVMGKMEIPNFGWMGVFSDPTGNRIGLWKSMQPRE